jgi:ABC-2 type transport system permease protein
MRKTWLVAMTEYSNAVRSKAFIIGVLALPVLLCLSIGLQYFGRKNVDIRDRRFAVVDRTGVLFPVIASKASERNEKFVTQHGADGKSVQVSPKFFPELFDPAGTNGGNAEVALSERVRREQLTGFVIINTNAFSADGGAEDSMSWFTQTHAYSELPDWLERTINEEIRRMRFEKAGLDQALVRKLTRNVPVKRLGLAKVNAATGHVEKARETNQFATFAVPAGCMFLLYMMVMSATPALLNSVLEEKMQKISEVLLSSVTPFQLMMGKLFGATMVSFTLSALYLASIGGLLWNMGLLNLVPPALILWFVFFQLLSLLIFGSLFLAIGSACSEIRDAQSFMFPVMMLVMLPFFVFAPIMQSPGSSFARWFSLFPPATPMLMMLRIAIPPGPPWWEIALGVALTTLFMLGCVWAGAKIFRIGILAQGQAPSFGKLLRWIVSR